MNIRTIIIAFAAILAITTMNAQDNSSLLKIGTEAPDFSLTALDGKAVKMSEFKGKYVLIDFWASWCPDCRKTNPKMVKLYEKYKDENIAFMGVSFDESYDAWKNAVAKDNLTWTHVSELKKWKETTISKDYGIKWIPTVYLIDPEGHVAYADVDGRGLEKKLTEVFGK